MPVRAGGNVRRGGRSGRRGAPCSQRKGSKQRLSEELVPEIRATMAASALLGLAAAAAALHPLAASPPSTLLARRPPPPRRAAPPLLSDDALRLVVCELPLTPSANYEAQLAAKFADEGAIVRWYVASVDEAAATVSCEVVIAPKSVENWRDG